MDKALLLNGKKYISARRAALKTGYTSDYVGQLCRSKKVDAKLVGRGWYVLEKDIFSHKNSKNHFDFDKKKNLSLVKLIEPQRSNNVKSKTYTKFGKVTYLKDDLSLFPNIVKKFDLERAKYVALKSIDESLLHPKKTFFIERFAKNLVIITFVLLISGTFIFEREDIRKFSFNSIRKSVKQELSFLYNPYIAKIQENYVGFQDNISKIKN